MARGGGVTGPCPPHRAVANVDLVEHLPPARLAFRFTPTTVRALVPAGVPGTYLLLKGHVPVYVGRSDTCLRTRLTTHNHLDLATHVLWESAKDAWQAFDLEAWWWHSRRPIMNIIHPATPAGATRPCPFCAPPLMHGHDDIINLSTSNSAQTRSNS